MILFDSRTNFEKDRDNHSFESSEKVDGNRVNQEQKLGDDTNAAITYNKKLTGFSFTF